MKDSSLSHDELTSTGTTRSKADRRRRSSFASRSSLPDSSPENAKEQVRMAKGREDGEEGGEEGRGWRRERRVANGEGVANRGTTPALQYLRIRRRFECY